MKKSIVIAILLAQVFANSVFAETQFDKAVQLYNQKQYRASAAILENLVKSEKSNDATSHYYLANAYSHLGRIDEALKEYRASYALDSKGESAPLCLQAIAHLTALKEKETAGNVPNQPAPTTADVASVTVDDKAVVSKLPTLPKTSSNSGPTLAQVQAWTDQERSNYMNQSQSRISEAQEKLDAAQKLLERAQSVVMSLVPNRRAFGETEQTFDARRKAGQERADALLAPYRENFAAWQSNLQQSKAIFEACQTSYRGYNGWMPVRPQQSGN